ncbi:hypothetical protein GGR56DRAFT_618420 [Xylariaceae sp. FL0804]|nr:hypothetical protein GGR56DRAFT_618420 [Xylariaceae sp. FL0804]
MAGVPNPDPVPRRLSLWAERFGCYNQSAYFQDPTLYGDGRSHSGLAPELPSLPPRAYAGHPIEIAEPAIPWAVQDRVFLAESHQKNNMHGLRSFQLGPLNGVLHDDISGGHAASPDKPPLEQWEDFRAKMFQVDEARWLPCFRKHNWFDMTIPWRNHLKKPIPGLRKSGGPDRWSVDNDVIWDTLRIGIELAFRIYNVMIKERNEWLQTLFFGVARPVSQDFNLAAPWNQTAVRISPEELTHSPTVEELEAEFVRRTERAIFSFFDPEVHMASGNCVAYTTYSEADHLGDAVNINFNIGMVLALFESDTSLAERCYSLFLFALAMVHEMAHLLQMKAPAKTNLAVGLRMQEPFYKSEWIAEMGHSLENEIFGLISSTHPNLGPGSFRAMAWLACVFPCSTDVKQIARQAYGIVDRNSFNRTRHNRWEKNVIPAFFMSLMFSDKFWRETVTPHGSKAFRFPRILRAMYNSRYGQGSSRYTSDPNLVEPLRTESEKFALRLGQRMREWRRLRPWYELDYPEWRGIDAPWNDLVWRDRFVKLTNLRNVRGLGECRRMLLSEIANYDNWYCQQYIPEQSWLIKYMVELLMLASLPWPPDLPNTNLAPDWAALAQNAFSEPREGIIRRKSRHPNAQQFYPSIEAAKKYTETPYTIRQQHPEAPPDQPVGHYASQQHVINQFMLVFQSFETFTPQPKVWLEWLLDTFRMISTERGAQGWNLRGWTNFPTRLPAFNPNFVAMNYIPGSVCLPLNPLTVPFEQRYSYVPWTAARQQAVWAESPPASPDGAPQAGTAPGQGTSSGDRGRRNAVAFSATAVGLKQPRYYTIGAVGNHRELDDAWVVHPDGTFGFDVYQITDLLQELGATESDFRAAVKTGIHGPQLVEDDARARKIASYFQASLAPIGKVITMRRSEEIAEFNGKRGAPSWIIVGQFAYDVTDFPHANSDERRRFDKCAGNALEIPLDEDDAVDLIQRLDPYLRAYVDPGARQLPRFEHHYTPRTLRWHDNPEKGLYIAIDNIVYDVTDYQKFHPGGYNSLRACGGRDASAAFAGDNVLKENLHQVPVVGRLVPEWTMNELKEHHIVIHDWVFDVSSLFSDDPELFKALSPYLGTNASSAMMMGHPGAEPLCHLFGNKGLLVAGLAVFALQEIPEGEFLLHNDPNTEAGAWVVVEGEVYSVSELMKYPEYYDERLPAHWAGRELTDTRLAGWLKADLAARRIGRLTSGPAWPRYEASEQPVAPEQYQRDPTNGGTIHT